MKSFLERVAQEGLVTACCRLVEMYTGKTAVIDYPEFAGFRDSAGVLWMIDDACQGDGCRIVWGKFADEKEDFVGSVFGLDDIFNEVCEFARHLELGSLEAYRLERKGSFIPG